MQQKQLPKPNFGGQASFRSLDKTFSLPASSMSSSLSSSYTNEIGPLVKVELEAEEALETVYWVGPSEQSRELVPETFTAGADLGVDEMCSGEVMSHDQYPQSKSSTLFTGIPRPVTSGRLGLNSSHQGMGPPKLDTAWIISPGSSIDGSREGQPEDNIMARTSSSNQVDNNSMPAPRRRSVSDSVMLGGGMLEKSGGLPVTYAPGTREVSPALAAKRRRRRCHHPGCTKYYQDGTTKMCISHGGGHRCKHPGCTKAARDQIYCCFHGGGPRCQFPGCTKSALGKDYLCAGHGGGNRCKAPSCKKLAQSARVPYCVRHGKGRKCQIPDCVEMAETRSVFCGDHHHYENA